MISSKPKLVVTKRLESHGMRGVCKEVTHRVYNSSVRNEKGCAEFDESLYFLPLALFGMTSLGLYKDLSNFHFSSLL